MDVFKKPFKPAPQNMKTFYNSTKTSDFNANDMNFTTNSFYKIIQQIDEQVEEEQVNV